MAHDALVLQQPLHVARTEARHLVDVKVCERLAEILALGEDRAPAQPRLEAFEAQLLEQAAVVLDREAPLIVVIRQVLRRGQAPSASQLAIGSGECGGHGRSVGSG
jgi:hypothetical protein